MRTITTGKVTPIGQEFNQKGADKSRHAERTALLEQKINQAEALVNTLEACTKQLKTVQSCCDYPESCVPKTDPELSAAAQAYEAALGTNPLPTTKKRAVAEEPAIVEEHTAAEGAVATGVSEVEEVVAMAKELEIEERATAEEYKGEEPATVEDQSPPRKWHLDIVILLLWNLGIQLRERRRRQPCQAL